MSIKAVEWALKQPVSSTAKLVLVMLADCINNNDEFAWPSQDRIAKVVGRSERQVRTHLKALAEKRLVRIVAGPGAGRGKGRTSDKYFLACDHRTGLARDLTAGSLLPPAKVITGGSQPPPVSVTAGSSASLQAEVSRNAYIEEPEKEPESLSRSSERGVGAKKAKPKKGRREYTSEFNAIWLSWPAHRRANSDKQTAFKRYMTGVEQFGAEPIARAAKHYLSQAGTRKENYRFCCLVEVFMNGKLEAAVEAAAPVAGAVDEYFDHDLKRWVEVRAS